MRIHFYYADHFFFKLKSDFRQSKKFVSVWSSDQLNIELFYFFFPIIRLTSAVPKVRMESERQAERVPELPSKKDTSNNLPSEPGEAIKVFEKNLERLENLVKLFKSDVNKMFDISDSSFPNSSINASPEK